MPLKFNCAVSYGRDRGQAMRESNSGHPKRLRGIDIDLDNSSILAGSYCVILNDCHVVNCGAVSASAGNRGPTLQRNALCNI